MIRVLCDENVHTDIISGLRKEGFALVTAVEAGLAGRKDQQILEYAEEHDLSWLCSQRTVTGYGGQTQDNGSGPIYWPPRHASIPLPSLTTSSH